MRYKDIEQLEGAIILDGLDDAIIGHCHDMNTGDRLVYSVDKIVDVLISQGMGDEEAQEYYDHNIGCLYAGEQTPVLVQSFLE